MRGIRKLPWLFTMLTMLLSCAPAVMVPMTPVEFNKTMKQPQQEYRILAGDQLEVKFYYHPEFNEQVTVRPDGRIILQLANELVVEGLTPNELTAILKKNYAADLDRPEIAVIVRGFSAQRVYVDGEVTRPGIVVLTGSMTLLQAISQAGGLKDTARREEIVIMRRGGGDSKLVTTMVDLNKVLDGTDPSQDLTLNPFDVVYVPKSSVANMNLWIDQYLRKNIPIPFSMGYTFGGL